MVQNKQYIRWLGIAVIVFFIAFIAFFIFFYKNNDVPVEKEETIETFIENNEEEVKEVVEETRIQPNARIQFIIKDTTNQTLLEKEIKPHTLVGLNKKELSHKFAQYTVTTFEEDLVVLERQVQNNFGETTYHVLMKNNTIGILEKGKATRFMPLQLSKDDFSAIDLELFQGEGLKITNNQKQELERQPYFIEVILQNYNE